MESDSETEESIVISRTYDKMKSSVHKIGYVEGLTSGKESAFQSGFDEGYKEGFSNGYQLGKLNGVLRVLQESSKDDRNISDVVRNIQMEPNTKRALCFLCNPQNMESCLKNSYSSGDDCSSLENNVKQQKEAVQQTVNAHLSKAKYVYELHNIPEPFPELIKEI